MGQEHEPKGSTSYHIDLSHQEMERIMSELEEWAAPVGPHGWVSVEAAAQWIQQDLGYEDMNEFEDALRGTFAEFLGALPNVELKRDEKERLVFKMIPDPPPSEWKARRMTLPITDRKQLWTVLVKSPNAALEIPELEFEISRDHKKKVDSLYNHLASAIFNLGQHVQQLGNTMSNDTKDKIVDAICALNILLDVETPWTVVVRDPSGLSTLSDMTGVVVDDLPADDPLAIYAAQNGWAGAGAGATTETEGVQPAAEGVEEVADGVGRLDVQQPQEDEAK